MPTNPGTSNLRAWYSLDETSGTRADSHTNSYDLTDNNTVGYSTGVVSNAASLASASSESLSRSGTDLSPGDTSWSICGWLKTTSVSGNQAVLGKDAAPNREYALLLIGSTLRAAFFDASGNFNFVDATVSANTWYFFAAGYDAGTNKGFLAINGAAKSETGTFSPYASATSEAMYLGFWFQAGWRFDGELDEIGFFDAVLSDDEIDWLYNSGSGRSYGDLSSGGAATAHFLTLLGVGG